ncbi:MAG: 16S rRNA (uracil(1498)-N(3))-methyltransferase [Candidatus Omnitrophica bacterium]|nr:16S rRNA (uracil(1498)-N(3))-methyltransferase [Candidatus Omnitrophota bacterium]
MSRVRIFQALPAIEDTLRIRDIEIVRKIKTVLRMEPGEILFVFDGEGKEFSYTVETISKKELVLQKKGLVRQEKIQPFLLVLAVPLLRDVKMEFILQKTCELGVTRIIPYISARGTVRKAPSAAKSARWMKIVTEAARQSERLWIPKVDPIRSVEEVAIEPAELKIVAHQTGDTRVGLVQEKKPNTALVIVGPEGDFSEHELQLFKENRFHPLSLSQQILRTETAAIFAVGLIRYLETAYSG